MFPTSTKTMPFIELNQVHNHHSFRQDLIRDECVKRFGEKAIISKLESLYMETLV